MPEESALIQRGILIKISHYLRDSRPRRGGFDISDDYIDMHQSTCRSRAAHIHISFHEVAHSRRRMAEGDGSSVRDTIQVGFFLLS